MHRPVDDASIILKIENSLKGLIGFLKEYKEPEKPKAPPIEGVALALSDVTIFISLFDMPASYASEIVDMAKSPSDYFEANENTLKRHQIFSPSENMYLLYLTGILEESGKIGTVDWKADYSDIVFTLNEIGGFKLEEYDEGKHKRSTAKKILSALNGKVENISEKSIFCIDSDSDSCSFGVIDKIRLRELIIAGKKAGIKIYKP